MFHTSHPHLDHPHCLSYIIIYAGRRRRRRSRGRRRRRRRSRDRRRRRRRRRSRREPLTYIDVIYLPNLLIISNHLFHCDSFHPQADPAVPVSVGTVLGRGNVATAALKERIWS